MVNVTINNNGKEITDIEGDYALTFLMSDLKDEASTEVISIAKGDFKPLYFYYLGSRLVNYINTLSNKAGYPAPQVLLALLKKGINEEMIKKKVKTNNQ